MNIVDPPLLKRRRVFDRDDVMNTMCEGYIKLKEENAVLRDRLELFERRMIFGNANKIGNSKSQDQNRSGASSRYSISTRNYSTPELHSTDSCIDNVSKVGPKGSSNLWIVKDVDMDSDAGKTMRVYLPEQYTEQDKTVSIDEPPISPIYGIGNPGEYISDDSSRENSQQNQRTGLQAKSISVSVSEPETERESESTAKLYLTTYAVAQTTEDNNLLCNGNEQSKEKPEKACYSKEALNRPPKLGILRPDYSGITLRHKQKHTGIKHNQLTNMKNLSHLSIVCPHPTVQASFKATYRRPIRHPGIYHAVRDDVSADVSDSGNTNENLTAHNTCCIHCQDARENLTITGRDVDYGGGTGIDRDADSDSCLVSNRFDTVGNSPVREAISEGSHPLIIDSEVYIPGNEYFNIALPTDSPSRVLLENRGWRDGRSFTATASTLKRHGSKTK